MYLFVDIPVQKVGPVVSRSIRDVVTDLFASSAWDGDYFFARTWERNTGHDCFHISLGSERVSVRDTRDLVDRVVTTHGFTATVDEIAFREIPSPLWNAGFGGPDFDVVSKGLCQTVAPILVEFAAELNRRDSPESYLLALRLMVAHAAATLWDSEQRELPSRSFDELLSLRLLSYRSHYEGIFARASDPESLERRYAAYYDEFGSVARDLVSSRLASPLPPDDDRLIRPWVDVVLANFATARDYFRSERIVNEGLTLDDLNKGRDVPLQPTRFHRNKSKALEQLLHRNSDFLSFRLHTSLLYSCLHTLGFSLVERYLFCYLLARANEDVSGKSTGELQRALGGLAEQAFVS